MDDSTQGVSQPRVFSDGLIFGEGLRWFAGRLWISDMLGRRVYAYTTDGTREEIARIPARPNGLGFLPDGRLVITSMGDQKLLVRNPNGDLAVYADVSGLMTGYCGDMAVGPDGRIYLDDVGYRVFEGEASQPGRLLRIDPDGSARVLLDGLAFPNGLWITPDGKRLIFAEGRASTVHSFGLSPSGELVDRRILARPANPVLDGLTVDRDGGVWQCCPHDHEIIRLDSTGVIVGRLRFPLKPVACCLGGPLLRTLYVVAADYTLERMARDECSARIFAFDVDTPGFLLPGDSNADQPT